MSEAEEHANGWFAANAVATQAFRTIAGEVDADVCIVGAGPAGLTAARELALRGWSVALLERGRVGAGPCGQSLGLVAAGFSESLDRIIARLGVERAKRLWALSAEAAAQVRATIAETGMEGVTPVDGELIVQTRDNVEAAQRAAAQLRYFGGDAEYWATDRVRETLRGPQYFQAVHRRDAFSVHPLNYLRGLAAAAEQAGARIFENAHVVAIDTDGVRKRVQTAGGKVRATHVILASDEDGARLHPAVAGTTVALARHMAAVAPLPQSLTEAVGFGGTVSHAAPGGVRYRVDGARLVWASALAAQQAPPWAFGRRVASQVAALYPKLRGAAVTGAWTAAARYAAHRMPQIGEVAPNLWLLGGFGDQAIATATMGGTLIARAIVQGDEDWRLFSPYGLTWTGGPLGKALVSLALHGRRVSAAVGDALARRRPVVGDVPMAAMSLALPPPVLPPVTLTLEPAEMAEAVAARPEPEALENKRRRATRKPSASVPQEAGGSGKPAPRTRAKRAPPSPQDTIRAKRTPRAKAPVSAPAAKANGHDHAGDTDERG